MDHRRRLKLKSCSGQGTLEMTVAMILVIMFIGAVTGIWLWSNEQIVRRQIAYQATRKTAGTSSDVYLTPVWPVYTPGRLEDRHIVGTREEE